MMMEPPPSEFKDSIPKENTFSGEVFPFEDVRNVCATFTLSRIASQFNFATRIGQNQPDVSGGE